MIYFVQENEKSKDTVKDADDSSKMNKDHVCHVRQAMCSDSCTSHKKPHCCTEKVVPTASHVSHYQKFRMPLSPSTSIEEIAGVPEKVVKPDLSKVGTPAASWDVDGYLPETSDVSGEINRSDSAKMKSLKAAKSNVSFPNKSSHASSKLGASDHQSQVETEDAKSTKTGKSQVN